MSDTTEATKVSASDLINWLPDDLKAQEWVVYLAEIIATDNWHLAHQAEAGEKFRGLAPFGLFTCASMDVQTWAPAGVRDITPANRDEYARALSRSESAFFAHTENWSQRHKSSRFHAVLNLILGWQESFGDRQRINALDYWLEMRVCERCGEIDDNNYTLNDIGELWCARCCDDEAYWSESAENYYRYASEMPEHEEDRLENHPSFGDNKYTSEFLGESESGNYYGIELEVESEGASLSEGADLIPSGWLFHFDGSLRDGLEFVSYPMSPDYFRESLELDWLRVLARKGWRSWDSDGDTCGLHIHISRAGFRDNVHIFAFAQFIYRNPERWQRIAGRHSSYASFDSGKRPPLALDIKNKGDFQERYVAVNMLNDRTVECRFFKGTLNAQRIRANLELVDGLVEYTRPLRIADLTKGALDFGRFGSFLSANAERYPNALWLLTSKDV